MSMCGRFRDYLTVADSLRLGSRTDAVGRAVILARWVAELSSGVFVPDRWHRVRTAVGLPQPQDPPGMRAAYAALFPN
jgi:hypothetical protein